MRAYPPSKFRVSSISGSRDSRGAEYAPPSRARNSQTLSRGRVNPRPVGLLPDPARRRGGGAFRPPPAISETTEAILKIQTEFDSPLKVLLGNQISLTSGSPMTSQVRSNKMFPLFNC